MEESHSMKGKKHPGKEKNIQETDDQREIKSRVPVMRFLTYQIANDGDTSP